MYNEEERENAKESLYEMANEAAVRGQYLMQREETRPEGEDLVRRTEEMERRLDNDEYVGPELLEGFLSAEEIAAANRAIDATNRRN